MNQSDFKSLLLKELSVLLQNKQAELEKMLSDLEGSSQNETKSSAGDKYETAIEMLKQEQNKILSQIQINKTMQAALQQIRPIPSVQIGLGALVKTQDMFFFISVSLGKITFQEKEIFCISPQAPIAKILLGKKQNESVVFNNKTILIEEVS